MKFNVYDEDGLFSLVNTDQYQPFVSEDWTLHQILYHFIAEMNKQHLIVWQTNDSGGGAWNIEILTQPTDKPSFREFTKTIEVTNGELHLVSYTDLTMAAQFEDYKLPGKENAHWKFPVANGLYAVTIRQLFDPADYNDENTEATSFEMILTREIRDEHQTTETVFWWED